MSNSLTIDNIFLVRKYSYDGNEGVHVLFSSDEDIMLDLTVKTVNGNVEILVGFIHGHEVTLESHVVKHIKLLLEQMFDQASSSHLFMKLNAGALKDDLSWEKMVDMVYDPSSDEAQKLKKDGFGTLPNAHLFLNHYKNVYEYQITRLQGILADWYFIETTLKENH